MIHQRPVIESIGNHYIRNAAVVIYLAADALTAAVAVTNGKPTAVLRLTEEIARPQTDEKRLAK